MMIATAGALEEKTVMSSFNYAKAVEFIELDADDARHFGYLGPHGVFRFLADVVLPDMGPMGDEPKFAEALTSDGWVSCLQGVGIPTETVTLRLYPAAIHYLIDLASHAGEKFMHEMFLGEYLSRLTCPDHK